MTTIITAPTPEEEPLDKSTPTDPPQNSSASESAAEQAQIWMDSLRQRAPDPISEVIARVEAAVALGLGPTGYVQVIEPPEGRRGVSYIGRLQTGPHWY